jgi:hypothetical protein
MTCVVGTLLVGTLGLFMGQTPSSPTAQEIIGNVLKATVPDRPYSTTVTQTVQSGGEAAAKTRFSATWSAKGLTIKRDSVEVLEPAGGKDKPGSDIQMGINIAKCLQEMLKWSDVKVTPDPRNGESYWVLSGQDPRGSACQLWVDATRWCVTRLVLDIQGRRSAEADFEYQRRRGSLARGEVNDEQPSASSSADGCWLLSKVAVKHADGTCISQEFAEYTFDRP